MRIDSSGRLLVGTSTEVTAASPSIQLVDTGTAILALGRDDSSISAGNALGTIEFYGNDGGSYQMCASIAAQADGTHANNDKPTRLVLATTADGASSPTERLQIYNGGGCVVHASSGGNVVRAKTPDSAGTSTRVFFAEHSASSITASGTISFNVYSNGNVQNTNNSYGSLSDVKLKENIVDASSQWDDLKAIQVRNYNFIEGQTHTQIGVVAQEVETISPGLVFESPDQDEEGNDLGTVTKSVN